MFYLFTGAKLESRKLYISTHKCFINYAFMTDPTADFWDSKYREGLTGWDIGYASPALMNYCADQSINKSLLIPGAGNAYEWIALKKLGFKDVTVLDISEVVIKRLKKEYPQWAEDLMLGDFFEHEGQYDLILEQTFFCALNPSLRESYIEKMITLLKPEGKLAGLLFNREFEREGPPFGGTLSEYESLFRPKFNSFDIFPSSMSIPERAGNELFFIASND